MGIATGVAQGFKDLSDLEVAKGYFINNAIGKVFKVNRSRVQFEASQEFLDQLSQATYIRKDERHKNSYLVPVGGLGWILLLTVRDDIVTADHYPTQIDVAREVFTRRGLLEPLRRILRSRNHFQADHHDSKFRLRLQKSALTLGSLDHLRADLLDAINERIDLIWEKCYGYQLPNGFMHSVEEEVKDRWHRIYTISVAQNTEAPVVTVAKITVIDKTFFLEI